MSFKRLTSGKLTYHLRYSNQVNVCHLHASNLVNTRAVYIICLCQLNRCHLNHLNQVTECVFTSHIWSTGVSPTAYNHVITGSINVIGSIHVRPKIQTTHIKSTHRQPASKHHSTQASQQFHDRTPHSLFAATRVDITDTTHQHTNA